ncbi:fumarate reductase subunit FrdD [Aeromonas hydrophila]|uniref:fumarate reductase subunit FrdD n=1 Tax=Aeromonas caviae TaxID=648 RepID=UPI003EC64C3C
MVCPFGRPSTKPARRVGERPSYFGFDQQGLVVAMLLPVIVLITGLLVPMGIMDVETMSYDRVHAFASSWWGACILLVIIALPIWHGMHRIYHGLHDLGIHTTKLHHYVFYGFAFLVSAITIGLLMVLVFQ